MLNSRNLIQRTLIGMLIVVSALALLGFTRLTVSGNQEPDSCAWNTNTKDRKKVKNRAPKPNRYSRFKNGKAISIAEFYELVCSFDPPKKAEVSQTKPIADLEEKTITIHGFLLAAKFERGEDRDIHAQIADSQEWNQDQLIIEIPAGKQFCKARKALWNLVRQDRANSGSHSKGDSIIFDSPPEVTVTGYLFLDAHHITKKIPPEKYCVGNGGRGLQKNGKSRVRGLWELHPVIDLTDGQ